MLLRRPKLPTITINFGLLTSAEARQSHRFSENVPYHTPLVRLALYINESLNGFKEDGEAECKQEDGVTKCCKNFCSSITWV
mgnify:CR=1 FL=1